MNVRIYETMLTQAREQGLRYMGQGTIDGVLTYRVNDAGHEYSVTITRHGLSCNCPSGARSEYCTHRAFTRYFMKLMQQPAPSHCASIAAPATAPVAYVGPGRLYR